MSSTNPVGIDRLAQLKALHLYGMATAWSELLAEGPRRPVQPEAWLDRLIEAELADRHVRSLRYQLKAARFPVHRDLTGIAVKLLPNEPIVETTPLAAGDCVGDIELSATMVTEPPQRLPINEIDFRGSLFDRAWTISLSGKIPDDPYQTLRPPVARTFPFCREGEPQGKPLTLGLTPVTFP